LHSNAHENSSLVDKRQAELPGGLRTWSGKMAAVGCDADILGS